MPDPPEPAEPLRPPAPGPAARPLAPETERLYASDWAAFQSWCRAQDLPALPASGNTVAAFLAAEGLRPGTIRRRRAAIAARHRRHGLTPPLDPGIRAPRPAGVPDAAGEAGADLGTGRADRRPPSAADLARMAQACPADLAGWRDRALLLLAAAGLRSGLDAGPDPAALGRTTIGRSAIGRAGLVGLDAEDVRFTDAGVTLTLRGRTGDRMLQLRRGPGACPVRALETWLRLSDTAFGPVFRKIDRWGNLEHRRLCADALRRILARRAVPGAPAPPGAGKPR